MFSNRVVVAGIVAGMAMGMIEMIYEAVAGAGFWAPVVFIGATVLRGLQAVEVPVPLHAAGVILGLMGHMMNSVVLGLVFSRLMPSPRSRTGVVGAGMLFGVAIFVVMWFLVLPWLNPVMLRLNGAFFALAHVMWGAVLGFLLPVEESAQARTGVPHTA